MSTIDYDYFERLVSPYPNILKGYQDAKETGTLVKDDEDRRYHIAKYCRAYFFMACLQVENEASDTGQRNADDEALVPFKLSDIQLSLLDKFEERMAQRRKFRHRVMKCRRAQVSTLYLAIAYHNVRFFENRKGLCFSDRLETSRKLQRILETFFQSDSLARKPVEGLRTLCEGLYLHNGPRTTVKDTLKDSYILLGSSEQKNSGIGSSLNFMVWCLDQKTPVQLENGQIERAKDCLGKTVVTHTGGRAIVKAISNPWVSDKNFEVSLASNSSFPVVCTPNHKFWISKDKAEPEWVEVRNIGLNDWAVLPIRKITNKIMNLAVPYVHVKKTCQPLNKPLDLFVETDFDLGRMIGIYLSEGYLRKNNAGACFSCHVKELDEWTSHLRRIAEVFGADAKPTVGHGSRAYVSIYSKALHLFLLSNFGEKDSKVIPDWVFDCGVEFLKGILYGYIRGDGHIDASGTLINIQSIRASSVFQIRDIVLSVYGGYPTMTFRPAGKFYGRNCRGIYRICICGDANRVICEEFGWAFKKKTRNWASKQGWFIRDGCVFVKIIGLEEVGQTTVCDLILDHPDHSFRLPGIYSHNSEAALSSDAKRHWTTISPALKGADFDVAESTPSFDGQDDIIFREFESPSDNCDRIFIPWTDVKDYQIDDKEKVKNFMPHTEHHLYGKEGEVMVKNEVSIPQMLWRRFKLDEMKDLNEFRRVFPISQEEAFYSGAGYYFNKELVDLCREKESPNLGRHLFSDQGSHISIIKDDLGVWNIYENTRYGSDYLIACDTAEGQSAEGDGRDRDYSMAMVFELSDPIREVASFRERYPPEVFAEQVAAAARHYNNAHVVPEKNNTGLAFIGRLIQGYYNVYREQRQHGATFIMTTEYGFRTTSTSKPTALSALQERMRKGLIIRTDTVFKELQKFQQIGLKYQAASGFHDDSISCLWLMAIALAQCPSLIKIPQILNGQLQSSMTLVEPKIERDDFMYSS